MPVVGHTNTSGTSTHAEHGTHRVLVSRTPHCAHCVPRSRSSSHPSWVQLCLRQGRMPGVFALHCRTSSSATSSIHNKCFLPTTLAPY